MNIPDVSILIEGLWDSPKALLASEAVKKRSVLLLTGGMREDRFFDNLQYFCPGKAVEFPAWETLPGEEILPSPDIIGKRFEALDALIRSQEPKIVLCPLASLLQKVLPKETVAGLLHRWKRGSVVPFATLPEFLTELGYKRAAVVSDKGEFAMRGGILDLFPVASTDPFRIEFVGDEIEEIRTFDPVGQKSIGKGAEVFLCPAVEMPFLQKAKRLVSIADYLGDFSIFWDDLLAIEDTYVGLKAMPAAKSLFFYSLSDLLNKWTDRQHIFCTGFHLEERFEMFGHSFRAQQYKHRFYQVEHCFHPEESPDPDLQFLFLNANETEEEEMKKQLASITLPKNTRWEKGYLTSGYCLDGLVVVPNVELTHRSRIRRQKWRSTTHTPEAEFHALSPGDLVVHFHSGIGRYLGMEKQTNHLGKETEFLTLQYAEGSKLFVPLSQAYLVSRYIGAKEAPPSLSELGSKRWHKVRAGAQAQIVGYANELLQLYAERAVHGGFRYPPDGELLAQFERDFPYVETQDQELAIQALKQDMIADKPMDRLICGDVGYGKTEVAMRAAFKAVADGKKQVAVLVPTT
ncbi:MAG: transcription-repair coupling factor, partial [Verrucomicrobiota bacterium]|nr:transcription-repair coupling factor [Verrucomicrobiota bacterium]